MPEFSCDDCPHKSACKTPCAAVTALLPAPERGLLHALRRKHAQRKARTISQNMDDTRFLLLHREKLQGTLRQVFDMFYNENLGHAEIARALGINRRAVGHLLATARRQIVRLARRQAQV